MVAHHGYQQVVPHAPTDIAPRLSFGELGRGPDAEPSPLLMTTAAAVWDGEFDVAARGPIAASCIDDRLVTASSAAVNPGRMLPEEHMACWWRPGRCIRVLTSPP